MGRSCKGTATRLVAQLRLKPFSEDRATGGWKIAQNAGQTIQTSFLAGGQIGATWTPRNYTAGWRSHSTYAKGNFQFERVVAGWRTRAVLDLRLKK
jgi:hypothetical protein